jgi:hypothetical protein
MDNMENTFASNFETRFDLAPASTASTSATNDTELTSDGVTWEQFRGWHDVAVANSDSTQYYNDVLIPELDQETIHEFIYGDSASLQYWLPIDSVEAASGLVQNIGLTGTLSDKYASAPSNLTLQSAVNICRDSARFQYGVSMDDTRAVTGPVQDDGSASNFNHEHAAASNHASPYSATYDMVHGVTNAQPQQSFDQAILRQFASAQHSRTDNHSHRSLHNTAQEESKNAGTKAGYDLSHILPGFFATEPASHAVARTNNSTHQAEIHESSLENADDLQSFGLVLGRWPRLMPPDDTSIGSVYLDTLTTPLWVSQGEFYITSDVYGKLVDRYLVVQFLYV